MPKGKILMGKDPKPPRDEVYGKPDKNKKRPLPMPKPMPDGKKRALPMPKPRPGKPKERKFIEDQMKKNPGRGSNPKFPRTPIKGNPGAGKGNPRNPMPKAKPGKPMMPRTNKKNETVTEYSTFAPLSNNRGKTKPVMPRRGGK